MEGKIVNPLAHKPARVVKASEDEGMDMTMGDEYLFSSCQRSPKNC